MNWTTNWIIKGFANMSEEHKPMDKWTALVVASAILAGAYLFVQEDKLAYLRQKDADKISAQKEIENKKEDDKANKTLEREKCLNSAYDEYSIHWDADCKILGRKKGCALPLSLSDRAEKSYKEEKEECIKMYPVN